MPKGPPHELDSMIPVSGDLVNAAKRPEQGAPVPMKTPIMKAR